jgi:hypothetical protein
LGCFEKQHLQQDRPKDGNIQKRKERTYKSKYKCSCCGVPVSLVSTSVWDKSIPPLTPSHPKDIAFYQTYQNLNSGSLLIKGLNSSSALVGSPGPPFSSSSPSIVLSSIAGSNLGCRKARKMLRR